MKGDMHMSCHYRRNEIDCNTFGLPAQSKYIMEIDSRDEPLRGQDCQFQQLHKRPTSYMREAPFMESDKAHCRYLHQQNSTSQYLEANPDYFPCCEQHCREDWNAQHLAAACMKSCQVPPAPPAPPIASCVTRSLGKVSAEASTDSAKDPFP